MQAGSGFGVSVRAKTWLVSFLALAGMCLVMAIMSRSGSQVAELTTSESRLSAEAASELQFGTRLADLESRLAGYVAGPGDESREALLAAAEAAAAAAAMSGMADAAAGGAELQAGTETLIALVEKMGVDEKSGLNGALRGAVHEIESSLNTLREEGVTPDSFMVEMLMLRRHEKDYMLRREEKYVKRVNDRVAGFVDMIANSDIAPEERERLTSLSRAYNEKFVAWAAAEAELRAHSARMTEGIAAIASDAALRQQELRTQAEALTQQRRDLQAEAEGPILAAMGGVVLAIMFSILLFGRSVIRPVDRLRAAMERMATGRLDVDLPRSDDRSEIGRTAKAIAAVVEGVGQDAEVLRRVAAGDLTCAVTPRSQEDVLRHSIARLIAQFGETLSKARDTSMTVAAAASRIREESTALARQAEAQNESADRARTSAGELFEGLRHAAENEKETSKISRASAGEAEKSGEVVQASLEAMRQISEKILIVQEIARQTDLLALNAAVEAARAGSHGSGFAVVAREVRKLAERSSVASVEISELSDRTLREAESAARLISEIIPGIRKTAGLVDGMSAASAQQIAAVETLTEIVKDLSRASGKSKEAAQAGLEEVAALASKSAELDTMISGYRVAPGADVRTAKASPRRSAAPVPDDEVAEAA